MITVLNRFIFYLYMAIYLENARWYNLYVEIHFFEKVNGGTMKKIKYKVPLVLLTACLFGAGLASCTSNPTSTPVISNTVGSSTTGPVTTSTPIISSTPTPTTSVSGTASITYKYNNGLNDTIVSIDRGELLEKPANPNKTGYIFVGWSTNESTYSPYDFNKPVINNLILSAFWKSGTVSITFNSNGGSAIPQKIGEPGTELVIKDVPTRINYAFAGWFIDTKLENSFVDSAFPSSDIVLYAAWNHAPSGNEIAVSWSKSNYYTIDRTPTAVSRDSIVNFSVTFAQNIDSSRAVIKANDTVLTSRRGVYSFIAAENTTISISNFVVKTFKVTFNSNNEELPVEEQKYVTEVSYGSSVAPHTFERTGYRLLGYYTDEALSRSYDFNAPVYADLNLYVAWEVAVYTITYSNLMDSYNTNYRTTYTYFDNDINLLGLLKTPDGLDFDGWLLNGEKVTKIPAHSVGDIELVASWTRWECTIEYLTQTDSTIAPTTGYFGDTIVFPQNPAREGFFFSGWYVDSQYKEPFTSTTYPARENILLIAKWSLVPEGSSTFAFENNIGVNISYTNSSAIPNAGYVETGQTVSFTLAVKSEEGYSGNPLVSANGLSIIPVNGVYTIVVNSDVRVVINGVTLETVTVNLNYNYSSGPNITKSFPKNSTIEAADLSSDIYRSGYVFKGWYYDYSCSSPFLSTQLTSSLTLYASWEIQTFTITLVAGENSDTGYDGNIIEFNVNSSTITIEAPTRTGYTFLAYRDSTNIDYVTIDPSNVLHRHDFTLYAVYKVNTFNVSVFNETGTNLLANYTITAVQQLSQVLRLGEINFHGYTIDPSTMYYDIPGLYPVNIQDRVTSNVNIYVRTTAKIYDIKFETENTTADIKMLDTNSEINFKQQQSYGTTVFYRLNRELAVNERLYITVDGVVTRVIPDENLHFSFVVGSENLIRVEGKSKVGITIQNNTGTNYELVYETGQPLTEQYEGDIARLKLSNEMTLSSAHIVYGYDNKGNKTELTLQNGTTLVISYGDYTEIRFEVRSVVTLSFEDSVNGGYSINGISDEHYYGQSVKLSINKALAANERLAYRTNDGRIFYIAVYPDLTFSMNILSTSYDIFIISNE